MHLIMPDAPPRPHISKGKHALIDLKCANLKQDRADEGLKLCKLVSKNV